MKEKSKEKNMKALSIEEKAKAYDEALSVAQETYTTQPMYRDWLAKMFPELKESEDEKMRKSIIYALRNGGFYNNDKTDEAIAWLEKQGNNPTPINIDKMVMKYSQTKDGDFGAPVNCMIRAYRKGIIDVLNLSSCIEKQNEQNPANSTKTCEDEQKPNDKIEPKFKVGDTIKCKYDDRQFTIKSVDLDKGTYTYTQEGCGNDIDYADENFELVGLKPAWSEEDAEMVEGLNNCLDELEEKNGWKYVYVNDKNVELTKVRNWLKLLKERVACEANCTTTKEWSEEEESIINKAESWLDTLCDYLKDSSPEYISDIKDVINKLQSIKDRYAWKPSDEQMEALDRGILEVWTKQDSERLMSLYQDLKKLREE